MSAAEILLSILVTWVAMYLLVGIIYGSNHTRTITRRIVECGEQERILKSKVSVYGVSPSGADYYTDLQEMHISEAETLNEYTEYLKGPKRYQFTLFVFGTLFWIYYLIYLLILQSQKRPVQKRA